ncbi:hypothetical protein D3C73_1262080 [compost metagenome]
MHPAIAAVLPCGTFEQHMKMTSEGERFTIGGLGMNGNDMAVQGGALQPEGNPHRGLALPGDRETDVRVLPF